MFPIYNFLVCDPDERVRSLFSEAFSALGNGFHIVVRSGIEGGIPELPDRSGGRTSFSAVFLSLHCLSDPESEIATFRRSVQDLPLFLMTDFQGVDIDRFIGSFPGLTFIQPPVNRVEILQLVRTVCQVDETDAEQVDSNLSGVCTPKTKDIVDHQKIVDFLRRSEEHYRMLVEESFDTIFIHDNGIILFANRQAREMFGYEPDEFIGMDFKMLVHPDSRPLLWERPRARALGEEAASKCECRLLKRDGSTIEAEINARTVTFDNHRITQTWVKDISERKHFEEIIIQAKQEWERTFDAVPDLIGILDKDSRFIRVNRALADRLGVSPKEVIGRQCCQVYQNRSIPMAQCACREMYTLGRSTSATAHLESLSGEFEITVSPILDKKGHIVGAVHVAHDISSQLQFARELERSLSALTATLDSTADGILVVAKGGIIQNYNRKFIQMWNIPSYLLEEKNPYHMLDYIAPQVIDGDIFGQNTKTIARQSEFEGLSLVRLKDGRVFERYTQPQRIGRKVVGRVWSYRDITARINAENALRESEEKYRFLVEKSLAGIYIIQDGIFRFGNSRFYRMLGYDKPEELLNQPFWAPVHPQDLEKVKERGLKREKGEPTVSHYTFQAVKKDGSPIWIELLADRVTYLGRPAVIGTILDQTERKKAEDALKESEQRFRDIFDNISDLIYTHDLEGKIISVNKAACRTIGFQEEEFLGFSLWEALPSHLKESYYDNYISKLKTQGAADGVTVLLTRDRHKRYLEYRSSIVDMEGREIYVRGSARDVTDRIRAEREMTNLQEQLLQSQKMEAVGTLAGGIAHDFNNILTGIVGNLDLAINKSTRSHSLYRYMKTALTAAERAKDLTRHLLTISRKTDPQKTIMDLGETIKETVGLLRQTIDRRILLSAGISPDLFMVQADATHMSQVLMNLCVNALDAIEKDMRNRNAGASETKTYRITITAENRTVPERPTPPSPSFPPGPHAVISVTDNGCGMNEETVSRIFEPFYTTKPMNKGTGLGLSTVYAIIKQHNGWIDVDSKPGQGSTFGIFLPAIVKKEAIPKSIPGISGIPVGHETILLVDDEDVIREFGREFLEELGYQVLLAEDGRKAIDVYKENHSKIDLTILDMVMPHLSGREVLEYLLKMTPQARVIISSGHFPAVSPNQRQDSRPNIAYMAKPYHLNELASAIRALLDKA